MKYMYVYIELKQSKIPRSASFKSDCKYYLVFLHYTLIACCYSRGIEQHATRLLARPVLGRAGPYGATK